MNFEKILVIQAFNIGDWIFTTPVLSMLLEKYPQAKIDVLGQTYVQRLIEACPYVNKFVNYDDLIKSDDPGGILAKEEYDLAIAISKHPNAVKWIKKAGIPLRIGALNRMHTWYYCNSFPWCSRLKSYPHEAQKNTCFLKPLGFSPPYSLQELADRIAIEPKGKIRPELEAVLAEDRFNLILHPGSNNHGREWSIDQYAKLIERLPANRYNILVTGREHENVRFASRLPEGKYVNLMGKTSMDELVLLLTRVQGLIASGTGTAHLAAALGIHSLALFPGRFKIGHRAWHPLGPKAESLHFKEGCWTRCSDGHCPCMDNISVEQVYQVVNRWAK